MLRYVFRRLLYTIPLLLVASVVIFAVIHATVDPGAALGFNPRVRAADIIRFRKALGLDRSGPAQYFAWLSHFARGDWGISLANQQAVWPQIRTALFNTLQLGIAAAAFSIFLGVGIGVVSSIRQYSVFDYTSTGAAFLGLSIPTFWFGLICQLVLGLYLQQWLHLSNPIFYTAGQVSPGITGLALADRARHLVLPMIVLSVQFVAVYSRYMRASMLEVLNSDYVRTARAKGLRERRVILHHGMRNAMIPVTTQIAIDIGSLAAGLVITESIFQWPGMGTLFLDAMEKGDYAIVLPWVIVVVFSVALMNLLADVAYAYLDPRVRYA